jgi:hypothetical protein
VSMHRCCSGEIKGGPFPLATTEPEAETRC